MQPQVSPLPSNFYAVGRVFQVGSDALREAASGTPSERLLQAIWQQQRFVHERLISNDGRTLRVLHPGFWNHEAGPDFRDAVVQLGHDTPRVGDVEIDLAPSGWRAHGHAGNAAYAKVILHVVWDGGEKSGVPTLALKSALDAPLTELAHWLGGDTGQKIPSAFTGQCCSPLRDLSKERLAELLHQAAQIRLQSKAAQLHARARHVGWEQALWEGLFTALGYKQNVWPMRRLAEMLPQILPRDGSVTASPFLLQARLLGVSGLLPAELTRQEKSADTYVRQLWDAWWREREHFAELIIPRPAWYFHGLRPANHPQRRLALAAHWLASGSLLARLEQWFLVPNDEANLVSSLLEIWQVETDEFWSWHWTFRSARLTKPQPLLGESRVSDLAMNVLLPWFWARAGAGKNAALQAQAEARYHAWPAAEDNAVLKLARQRLLANVSARALRTASAQQGLLQIIRDFCGQSDATCAGCRFPELVRAIVK